MSTRRDTKLTSAAEFTLFEQLRGLFRHVPFTARDFANLAPNVALTLSPDDETEALPVLWDVLDAQERTNQMRALLALIGASDMTPNVDHRKAAFNNQVNSRTVSRWADTALCEVVRYIVENYENRYAYALVGYSAHERDITAFEIMFSTNVDMDAPRIEHGVDKDTLSTDTCSNSESLKLSVESHDALLRITWSGPIIPSFEVFGSSRSMCKVLTTRDWLSVLLVAVPSLK